MIEYTLTHELEKRLFDEAAPIQRITIENQDKYIAERTQATLVTRTNDLVPILHFEEESQLTMFLLKWS